MTREDYLKEFQKVTSDMLALTKKKNADYAGESNPFANFQLIEKLGAASTEQGFVVRMSDKLQRISNLISRPNQVADEKIEDTLLDLSIYSILFLIFLKDKAVDNSPRPDGP
jgi:hypothetical protein